MKSVNRKILMTLIGVVLTGPFLVIASVVGIHAASKNGVRVDLFCLGLALASIAARIINEHYVLRTERARPGLFSSHGDTDLRESSVTGPRY